MSKKVKNVFLAIIAGVLIFVFSVIVIAMAVYMVLSIFWKDFLIAHKISLDGLFNTLSYILSFISVCLGAWSIYKATRSDEDIKEISNSVSIIKTQQDTILSLGLISGRGESTAQTWSQDNITK